MAHKISDSQVELLVRILALHDTETVEHTRRVAPLAMEMAHAYGLPKQTHLHIWNGALLHDIGKIAVPRAVLKKKSRLNAKEKAILSRHPVYARNILKVIPSLRQASSIPYHHHERWDGHGYPLKLRGREIPLEARLFTVVDVWDALTSSRAYRPAWPDQRAAEYLCTESGKHFDPEMVNLFLNRLTKTNNNFTPGATHGK